MVSGLGECLLLVGRVSFLVIGEGGKFDLFSLMIKLDGGGDTSDHTPSFLGFICPRSPGNTSRFSP